MSEITIYTDGSSLGNPGPGGYGVILKSGKHYKELSQGYRLTTNNRMELLAVIVALESLKKENSQVMLYTDSKYVVDAINKNWLSNWQKKDFKGKKNIDLWKRFLLINPKHKVIFNWVKGHAGHEFNERCDVLAVEAANSKKLLVDEGYEAEEEKNKGLF
jgi:ribonuclease HI